MLEKIQHWEYVDLAEQLPFSNIHDAAENMQSACFTFFVGWEFVQPKRKQIEMIFRLGASFLYICGSSGGEVSRGHH